MDAHPEIGNNAVIINSLGAKIVDSLFDEWGFVGKFGKPQAISDLAQKCSTLFEHDVMTFVTDQNKVSVIGVVSGGAKPNTKDILEMKAKGVELFITGEPFESVPHKLVESDINYFTGGHYATEVFGIQELGKAFKSHFKNKLTVEFIDIPNPI